MRVNSLLNREKNSQRINKKRSKTQSFYVQDLIGIDKVIGNVIFMSDGGVCGLLEVLPLNYYNKSIEERNFIIEQFAGFFKGAPQKLHFKIRTEDSNVDKTISYIRKCCKNETDPKVLAQVEDYISQILSMKDGQTLCQKFFVIYEYDVGSDGTKSNDIEEIYRSMAETKYILASRLNSMGNIVVDSDNETWHTCEVLYNYFNPNSSIEESFLDRYLRMSEDMNLYNSSVPEKYQREYFEPDYFAPRGVDLKTRKNSYLVMDGQYHTYLSIKDNGYPGSVPGGWLNIIGQQKGVDVDVILERKNREQVLAILAQYNRITHARINLTHNEEKAESLSSSLSTARFIKESMEKNDEDLYDVMTIITIRSNSFQEMEHVKNSIAKRLEQFSIYCNDSTQTVKQYFDLVMPATKYEKNFITSVFARDKHNFLTSSLSSMYFFTSYELFDDNCLVIGRNPENYTLVGLNNFNTRRYSNPHICILGGSGAGKTFTEEMLAYRMRMSNIRVMIIAPIKARIDYYSGCQNIGGSFITLTPKSPNRINIMAIIPAAQISEEERKKQEEEVDLGRASMLSMKIASLQVFIQLLMDNDIMTPNERTKLTIALNRLYGDFGITDDDRSVWKNRKKHIVKDMPILEDLYERIRFDPHLNRISTALIRAIEGDCQSLNGHTNVDLSNKYIVFDVDSRAIPEELLPVYMYVAVDRSISMAQESTENLDAIFLDEVWKIMQNKACAKQIMATIKTLRAFGACAVVASQDLEDLINHSNGYGSAIINNTAIKLFLRMDKKEISFVNEVMHFSLRDRKKLEGLFHQALIYSSGDKILCDLKASEWERAVFCTDPVERKRLKEIQAAERKSNISKAKKKVRANRANTE